MKLELDVSVEEIEGEFEVTLSPKGFARVSTAREDTMGRAFTLALGELRDGLRSDRARFAHDDLLQKGE